MTAREMSRRMCARHSFATWSIEGGEPIEKVSRHMGHSTIQQTIETYSHALVGNRNELKGMRDALRGLTPLALPQTTE